MSRAHGLAAAVCVLALGADALASQACAQEARAPSFQGKTLTMIVGFEPGGGTDSAGRLIAQFIGRHLPGAPKVNVHNMPGADGLIALNHFVQAAKPDGATFTMGASTQVSPARFRMPQSRYNPAEFEYVGGTGRGGTVLLINKGATARLRDKAAAPVAMGSLGGMPRSGMLATAWGIEFLDWNARWVLGYRGTNDLMIALERGEIDMTATGNMFLIEKMVKTGRFEILAQSGQLENGRVVGRADFGEAPVFPLIVEGKISEPLKLRSFRLWSNLTWIDKWVALPPRTPAPVVDAYRAAFARMARDEEFLSLARKISEDLEPQGHEDVRALIETVASTPDAAVRYLEDMLKRQGLDVKE
jgi:tripartite-type tricarboxylate transporter receptor subunit TctC